MFDDLVSFTYIILFVGNDDFAAIVEDVDGVGQLVPGRVEVSEEFLTIERQRVVFCAEVLGSIPAIRISAAYHSSGVSAGDRGCLPPR